MRVLVAGGAGYIGSTVCAALQEAGHVPIVLDSLITGEQAFAERYIFYRGDISDECIIHRIVKENGQIEAAIHLAGLIYVPESKARTYEYYRENVGKTIEFLHHLNEVGCKNIIFSSSASVYGKTEKQDVDETIVPDPNSPYARNKAIIENIIEDYCNCYNMRGIALRYFNPIGADPKMRSGSYVKEPSMLLELLVKTVRTKEKQFTITGVDWNTRDGSGIRDYIHVWDLARAHVSAVENIGSILSDDKRFMPINIGRGEGVTVKEFVREFETVIGEKLDVRYSDARPGDVAGAYAVCTRANELLKWRAELSIEDAIRDALKWDQLFHQKELS